MRTARFAVILCAVLGVVIAGCEDGGPGGVGGGPTIVISNTWQVQGSTTRTFFFRSPDDGNSSGLITGRENGTQFGDDRPLGGFWSNGRIEITVYRSEGNQPKFVATFQSNNPNELQFAAVNGSETFVLRR
jgi:hypothetical protein